MVRPAASEENKRIGLMFARAVSRAAMALRAAGDGVHPDPAAAAADGGRRGAQVTTPVESEDCPVVARTGRWSIFCALQECCPSAVRNDDPYIGKYGMTEIELNKVLEKNNFIKIRDRSSSAMLDVQVMERASQSY
jgi:hypothetical protein